MLKRPVSPLQEISPPSTSSTSPPRKPKDDNLLEEFLGMVGKKEPSKPPTSPSEEREREWMSARYESEVTKEEMSPPETRDVTSDVSFIAIYWRFYGNIVVGS
jgi:hypothetical protein